MDIAKLKVELIEDEGLRRKPYKDTRGIWTGGIGHNLEAHGIKDLSEWLVDGIPDSLIDEWFRQDIQDAEQVARGVFGDLDALPDPVARALVNMTFDLMWEIRQWHHLIDAIREQDWAAAQESLRNSLFARECPNRVGRLCARIGEAINA